MLQRPLDRPIANFPHLAARFNECCAVEANRFKMLADPPSSLLIRGGAGDMRTPQCVGSSTLKEVGGFRVWVWESEWVVAELALTPTGLCESEWLVAEVAFGTRGRLPSRTNFSTRSVEIALRTYSSLSARRYQSNGAGRHPANKLILSCTSCLAASSARPHLCNS